MSFIKLRPKHASVVWIEQKCAYIDGKCYKFDDLDAVQQLAKAIVPLSFKHTSWIVDDVFVPMLLLRDITDIPPDVEARDAFFRWRYSQSLGLDLPQSPVQALNLEKGVWLLSSVKQQHFDNWVQSATIARHYISKLVPRWVWLYNRLAPNREVPGLLLSLSTLDNENFTGTLAAWNDGLVLLRQWADPAPIEMWNLERLLPTMAYLQREQCAPQEFFIWGSNYWPDCGNYTHIMQPEIPIYESI